ncbi:MAG: 23S rRNA (adenine(2503)-C(2))-methyltransferase RlmN [Planctomycetota bacterium]|nr:MAG: 23S rRNA (adenine(2503)-C(2))-methyltransferase RlmN [Planctomycetota bacterium]
MAEPRTPILALDRDQARSALAALGVSALHADRIRRRLLAGAEPLAERHGGYALPARLAQRLEQRFLWLSLQSVRRVGDTDGAEKHLLRLSDGETVEAVRLPGSDAPSACLSTQVGCAVACRFCASGLDGVRRNLEAHEILEQVALLRRHGPVRRLVFMGAGEPTHNLRALAQALVVLRDEAEIGPRSVLVSTVGPAAAVDRLASLGLKFTLALSLHSVARDVRASLIPTQPGVDPLELLAAADRFHALTGRSYQVEYVLLADVNDARADARALSRALRGRRAHVSVIAWNPVPGMPFRTPEAARTRAFLEVLHEEGVSCTLRRTVGGEVAAACGQLRAGSDFQAAAARNLEF